jgi:Na+-translocating ferredoxin:NAD+ oxidoreductase subunit D
MNEIRWAPHIHSRDTTAKIMWTVVFALFPALAGSTYFFGPNVLKVVLVSVISCVLSEVFSQIVFGKKIRVNDGSALVTGLLLAFILPPGISLWMVAVGGFLAIFVAKELFGGIGCNIFNPALTGRAILTVAFPLEMTQFTAPLSYRIDAVTTATPLGIIKEGLDAHIPSMMEMFIGNRAGCIGETSTMLLLLGGILLLSRRVISWHIPITYILTVALLSFISGHNPLFQIMAGGLMLGAFFMATDYTTSPITNKGKIIFALGCGVMTFLIRQKGGYPEGVMFSIIFMNMFVPLIDKYTLPKKFGLLKTRRKRFSWCKEEASQ